jgi:hypothetical protein
MMTFWVGDNEYRIEHVEYTGVNTARIRYKAPGIQGLRFNGVRIRSKSDSDRDYTTEYMIWDEGIHHVYGRVRYYVDIRVRPDWKSGHTVHVISGGAFSGLGIFVVP